MCTVQSGEGPVIGGRGVGGSSPGVVHGGPAQLGGAGYGAGTGGHRWCRSGR
jgi:hypothetical protein